MRINPSSETLLRAANLGSRNKPRRFLSSPICGHVAEHGPKSSCLKTHSRNKKYAKIYMLRYSWNKGILQGPFSSAVETENLG